VNILQRSTEGQADTAEFINRITTNDLGEVHAIFEANGICILRDALSGHETRTMRAALLGDVEKKKSAGLAFAGVAGIDKDDKNLRVIDLPNIDPCFVDLLRHPLVERLVRRCLGRDALLSAYNANITHPGAQGMGWHTDQGYFPRTWAPELMALNIGWALDDVTEENGGTLVVPGSRDLTEGPSWTVSIRASQSERARAAPTCLTPAYTIVREATSPRTWSGRWRSPTFVVVTSAPR
jgi:ectoine hydroxylase-related dioxygenase (phytanoyl-CoA dioxygenase family)